MLMLLTPFTVLLPQKWLSEIFVVERFELVKWNDFILFTSIEMLLLIVIVSSLIIIEISESPDFYILI